MIAPLATLTRIAAGFIRASSRAPISPRVALVSGSEITSTSATASTSSRSASVPAKSAPSASPEEFTAYTRPSGHFSSPHRNNVPAMLSGGAGQPQPWAIVAARVTSMGHRCGYPARLNSINVPSLRLRPRGLAAKCPVGQESGGLNSRHPDPGAERAGNRVARNDAAAPDAVTFTKCESEPHRWPIVAVRQTRRTTTMAHGCGSRSIGGTSLR